MLRRTACYAAIVLVVSSEAPSPQDAGRGRRLIQLFAFHFPPSNASGAARPGRLARYLPDHGVECRVTACAAPGAASSPRTAYLEPGDARGKWRLALWLAKALQRIAPYNEQLPWLAAALEHSFNANRAEPACAVLSTSPPLAAHLAALLFRLRFGVPWIADFRDPLAGNPFRNRPWARGYDEWLESVIVRNASAVLLTNDPAAERLRKRHPEAAPKIHVLWNGFDPQSPAVRPAPAVSPRRLVHAGSLYGPRRPDALLRALASLHRSGRLQPGEWLVQFIGPFEADTFAGCAEALDSLQKAGLVELRGGLRPREELDAAVAQASLLLLLDLTGSAESVQVPAKLFDYIRTGLPVVAWSPAGSPTRSVLERSGLPCLLFEPGEPENQIAERLLAWLENPPSPAQPSEWFLETFDGARQAGFVARLIEDLAGAAVKR